MDRPPGQASPWQCEAWGGGGTDKGRIDVAAMGGKARKPLRKAAKPRVQLYSHPRQPHARGNGSKCWGHRGTLGPHASHWPGLLFVSPAPLRWQLTAASLALRGEWFKEEGRIREPRSPCMTRHTLPSLPGRLWDDNTLQQHRGERLTASSGARALPATEINGVLGSHSLGVPIALGFP